MNNQPGQPAYTPYLQPVPGSASTPQSSTVPASQPSTTPANQPVPTAKLPKPPKKKSSGSLLVAIIAIISSLVAITFIGLFIWMWTQWDDARTNVEGQISSAVATAVSNTKTEDEAAFIEREKDPYNNFSAPDDYGALEFKYPKTWSVYISKDASNGGGFSAILNPDRIIAGESIYALRVDISTTSYESVINKYTGLVKSGKVTQSTQVINGETANIYRGSLPGSSQNSYGIALIIKIRDKVATIQTDAQVFENDFNNIINTIKYNP